MVLVLLAQGVLQVMSKLLLRRFEAEVKEEYRTPPQHQETVEVELTGANKLAYELLASAVNKVAVLQLGIA